MIVRRALVTRGKRFARAAGAVYLLVVVVAAIVQVSVHAGIDVPGTAKTGAQDFGSGSAMPAVGVGADVALAMAFLLVGVMLYLLFRHVDRRAAGAPVVYLAVGVGLLVVNLLFHHAALLAASDSSTGGRGAQSVNGLVSMLLDLSDRGYAVAGAVLGLCLLPLGSLAYRSSRLPRVIGALLVVGLGVSTLTTYALPGLPTLVQQALAPPPIADFWLVLYLVARAGRLPRLDQQQDQTVSESARRRSDSATGMHDELSSEVDIAGRPTPTDSEDDPWSSSATTVTGRGRWACAGRCWKGIGATWIISRTGWSPAVPPSPTTEPLQAASTSWTYRT